MLYPHHLQTLVTALEEAGRGSAVYSHAVKVVLDEDGRAVERSVVGAQDFDAATLAVTNYVVSMGVLAPRADLLAVGGLDESLRVLEDWELWIRLSARLAFRHVPVPTAEYRWRPGKENVTVREWFRFHAALERVYALHPLPADSPLAPARQRMLDHSAGRAEAFAYELTLAVLCDDDQVAACATLEHLAEHVGESDGVEVLLVVPSLARWSGLAAAVEGDVRWFEGDGADTEAVLSFLDGRRGGRRMGWVRAGERLDAASLRGLLDDPAPRATRLSADRPAGV